MEDMESDETSTEEKSNAIMEKIHEMISYVIEKINAFIAWAMEKFRNGFKKLKEVANNTHAIVGRAFEQRLIDIVRKRLGGMLQLSKAIDAYIPLVHDLALWRGEISKADAGHVDEGLPHELINHMESMYRSLDAYSKKFGSEIRHAGIQIIPHTERIVHNTALASAASFSKNFFEVKKVLFSLGAEEVTDETMGKIGHDLISQIEDVVDAYARYTGDHGTSSLTTMGKNIKKMLESIQDSMKNDKANRYTKRFGKTKMAVLRECVHGISKDIASIVTLSSAIDKECGSLSSLLGSLKNIEMEPATA